MKIVTHLRASRAAVVESADQHTERLRTVVEAIRRTCGAPLGVLTSELTDRGIRTPREGRWHNASARNLVNRFVAFPSAVGRVTAGRGVCAQ